MRQERRPRSARVAATPRLSASGEAGRRDTSLRSARPRTLGVAAIHCLRGSRGAGRGYRPPARRVYLLRRRRKWAHVRDGAFRKLSRHGVRSSYRPTGRFLTSSQKTVEQSFLAGVKLRHVASFSAFPPGPRPSGRTHDRAACDRQTDRRHTALRPTPRLPSNFPRNSLRSARTLHRRNRDRSLRTAYGGTAR